MQIQYIGHAGFLIKHNDIVLVCDPWLSYYGAFDSAWFQFPSNHHLKDSVKQALAEAGKAYIYISHEHKDHFDEAFINEISDLNIHYLIPSYHNNNFVGIMQGLSDQVIPLKEEEEFLIDDLSVRLFLDDGAINKDSGILVNDGTSSFLNINDCKIFDKLPYIKQHYGPVDVFTCQFSGATWHPTCYEYEDNEYQTICTQKKLSKFVSVYKGIKALEPRLWLPSAGPCAFLDPQLYSINQQPVNTYPHQWEILEFLGKKNITTQLTDLMPGDILDSKLCEFVSQVEQRVTKDNCQQVLETYQAQYKDYFEERAQVSVDANQVYRDLKPELEAKVQAFTCPEESLPVIYYQLSDMPDQFLAVDLVKHTVTETTSIEHESYYRLTVNAVDIRKVLDQEINWEDFSLTFRVSIKRVPDLYNTYVNDFLFNEKENMAKSCASLAALKSHTETVEIEANGKRYQIQKYCPHQGAELQFGWCEDNHWICPRHRWRFDLEDGGKSVKSGDSICAVELVEDVVE